MSQDSPQPASPAWQGGYADAMAAKRIDVPRNRPAWTGRQRQLYLDEYMTGLAYLLGILHGREGHVPMTWPQVKADALWIGRLFGFEVEPGGPRYQSAYKQGFAAGTPTKDGKENT